MINEKYKAMLGEKSVIRMISERAAARRAEIGADEVFDFSIGNPSVPCTPAFTNAVIDLYENEAPSALHGYSPSVGITSFRGAVADSLNRRFGMDYTEQHIFPTSGATGSLAHAFRAVTKPGDEVLTFAPFFPEYIPYVEGTGATLTVVPPDTTAFQIDFEAFERALNPNVAVVLINTPNNPTGNCFNWESLEKVAEIAKRYDLLVIADDIYGSFSYAEEFVPIMSLPGMRERTITINSFSKNFTMTGWRVGNIIAPDYLVSTIQTINENVVFTAPSVSQRAAIYAIRDRKRIQPPMIEEYKKRVCYAIQRINAIPKMSVMEARGTFYLFVNIKETGLTSVEAADRILKEAHVLTLPGDTFGACGEGYLRLACTVGVDKLKEVFDRIEKMELFR